MTAVTDVRQSGPTSAGTPVGQGVAADLGHLALVVVVDALFLFGVLLPHIRFDGGPAAGWVPDVMAVPILLTVFFLPWVTLGTAAISCYRLWRGPLAPLSRGICLSVVVLGVAGFVTYVSPWGIAATRWLMD